MAAAAAAAAAAVLRCCGAAVLRCCGAAVLRCCGVERRESGHERDKKGTTKGYRARQRISSTVFKHVGSTLGAKYCTPEINTSEFIVDVQWHFQ